MYAKQQQCQLIRRGSAFRMPMSVQREAVESVQEEKQAMGS